MEDLDILENSLEIGDFADDDSPIQRPTRPHKEDQAPKATKKKRTPTPKQLEVLEKAREKMLTNAREKRIKKQLEDEAIESEIQRRVNEYKKGIEEKIVRKAIAVKKREIMKQAAIDEISDDDTPMEKVVAKVVRKAPLVQGTKTQKSSPTELDVRRTKEEVQPLPEPAIPVKKYIFV
jgi:hypothetical protein